LQLSDIHGDLHDHTNASDGAASIEQMAEAAMQLGYKFLAITDHSKSSVIANGLSVERLMKHAAEIRKISDRLKGITLLAGCEVDILADGHLDFEDEILAELDWVVASPHVALKQTAEISTARILRAIENRYVNVIGHPTGRIIQRREGLPLDLPKIFKAAAENGTALELNAAWPRFDLNDVSIRAAIAAGGKITIDTDAHSTEGLGAMKLGVSYARRAWVQKNNVVNCMTLEELRSFVKAKR
jgi:DNA polymerase (family 10)